MDGWILFQQQNSWTNVPQRRPDIPPSPHFSAPSLHTTHSVDSDSFHMCSNNSQNLFSFLSCYCLLPRPHEAAIGSLQCLGVATQRSFTPDREIRGGVGEGWVNSEKAPPLAGTGKLQGLKQGERE